jgi:IcmF-related N-terminal domain
VTKADMLPGFREFSVRLKAEESYQIFGWSSPIPDLDTPFDPAEPERGLDDFIAEVRERCMAWVAQPDPNAGLISRISQVDEMFTLPSSFRAKAWKTEDLEAEDQTWTPASSLALYLKEIFRRAGGDGRKTSRYKTAADTKQLFMRGVYFTSSMQTGPVYDPETAKRYGLSKERPKGTVASKVYFLRDLVMRKILPEKGLVTPLENIKQARRKQAAIVMGAAGLALLLLVAFIFLGRSKLRHSIEGDVAYWNEGRRTHTHDQGAEWLAARDYELPDENKKMTDRLDFHQRLFERTRHALSVPFPYGLFVHLSEESARGEAQWRLFTNDFLFPFVEKVRAEMQNPPNAQGEAIPAQMTRLQAALLAQVQLEADIAAQKASSDHAGALLKSGIELLSATDNYTNRDFTDTFLKTLFDHRLAPWPLPELSRGGDYSKNSPISGCVNWLVSAANSQNQTYSTNFNALNELQRALSDFEQREIALSNALGNEGYTADQAQTAVNALANLGDSITQKLPALGSSAGLWNAYTNLLTEVETTSSKRFADLVRQLPANCPGTFSNDIAKALLNVQGSLRSGVADKLNDLATRALDAEMLGSGDSDKRPDFAVRVQCYQDMLRPGDQCHWQIGVDWKPWRELGAELDKARNAAKSYHGAVLKRFQAIEDGLKNESVQLAVNRVQDQYVRPARQAVSQLSRQGVQTSDPGDWLKHFAENLETAVSVEGDTNSLSKVSPSLSPSDIDDLRKLYGDCTRAVDGALAAYPKNLQTIMRNSVAFPLTINRGGKAPMDLDGLTRTKALVSMLQGRSPDSPAILRANRCAAATQGAMDLFLKRLDDALNLLLPPGGPARCKLAVSTTKSDDAGNSALKAGRLKRVDDSTDVVSIIDSSTNPLGEVSINEAFSVELMLNKNSSHPGQSVEFGPWALLDYVLAQREGPLERPVTIKNASGQRLSYVLRLQLTFSDPRLTRYSAPF